MNRKMVLVTTGKMVLAESVMLLLPLGVALLYGEACALPILLTAAIAAAVGLLLMGIFRTGNSVIYPREGFAIVAFSWLAVSAIGALPFVFSGEIPSYVDAFFETVSGFTTTGASILTNVEAMSRGLLFWRSFTHWVGGMGVLVFVIAILPTTSDRTIHILRAEMPGPIVGKLVPRARDTARVLYRIYIVMTVAEILLLLAGGMNLFESVVHSFGTAGTGGFGVKADSIGSYSPYLQWVITVFMFLFGVNFNLYYLLLIRRFRAAAQSTEFWVYLGIAVVSAALITVNVLPQCTGAEEAIRLSAFQVSSIMTTTGYATTNFDLWPSFSRNILLLLMFIGASAGSTGGGFKVSRLVITGKLLVRELKNLISPHSANVVRYEGKRLDEKALHNVSAYLTAYVICFIGVVVILSREQFGFLTIFSAAAACFNNIGPGLELVGPAGNYAAFGALSKLTLSFAMLLGRLEIFPLLLLLSPRLWLRKK